MDTVNLEVKNIQPGRCQQFHLILLSGRVSNFFSLQFCFKRLQNKDWSAFSMGTWEVWMRKIDIENVRQGSLAPISESE